MTYSEARIKNRAASLLKWLKGGAGRGRWGVRGEGEKGDEEVGKEGRKGSRERKKGKERDSIYIRNTKLFQKFPAIIFSHVIRPLLPSKEVRNEIVCFSWTHCYLQTKSEF